MVSWYVGHVFIIIIIIIIKLISFVFHTKLLETPFQPRTLTLQKPAHN